MEPSEMLEQFVAEREQWDDGNNALAVASGVVVAYERNAETNARLADSGIEVLPIEASEPGTGRGGPALHVVPGR
jgi:arginine deiminase